MSPTRLASALLLAATLVLGLRAEPPPNRVVVYYFHGNARCTTCRTLEAQSRKAVTEGFPQELASGGIVFQPVNLDEEENEHFLEDFQLFTRCVVVAREEAGKVVGFTTLDKVWDLVWKQPEFLAYLRDGIRGQLQAKP